MYICECKLALEQPGFCQRCGTHAVAYSKVGFNLPSEDRIRIAMGHEVPEDERTRDEEIARLQGEARDEMNELPLP